MIRPATLLPLLLCALFCIFPQPLCGASLDFPDFSVELPSGWQIERDGNSVAFLADDKSATMLVAVESIASLFKEGMSARELAEAYAEEFKGSAPVMEDEDPNYYSFTFTAPDGRDSEASIVVSGRRFYLISISGRHPDLAGMVESILLSIQ